MKTLVIVESPSKAKTINKYLGSGYEVKASKGHIVDLPKSDLGIDIEKNFEPKYVVTKRSALKELKTAFKGKNKLVLAVDPDREGEAIGWHVAQKLGVINANGKIKKGFELQRIVFSSITKESIEEAIKNPRVLDMNLVDAQQARRVLDRLVGYKLSPLLWKKIRFGLSAGRVQSIAVKLIVEREEERQNFKSQEYWTLESQLAKKKTNNVRVEIIHDGREKIDTKSWLNSQLYRINNKKPEVSSEKETEEIIKRLEGKKWVVKEFEKNEINRNPKPPFTTSTLQQTASNALGFSSKRTMSIAQKLYEGGHISYMRTDSQYINPDFVNEIRRFVSKKYGKSFIPLSAKFYKSKSKNIQEAHEAIRPTSIDKDLLSTKFSSDEMKLYRLIWNRTVASQMCPAIIQRGTIDIVVGDCIFRANGQRIIFKGYIEVYPDKLVENILPEDIHAGDEFFPQIISGIQHFTQPSARYSEATLIKALETYGIGRPSTYVPILSTIQIRKYVEKDGKYFYPTDIGFVVTKLLRDNFPQIVDYEFTADIENKLDKVAEGSENWRNLLSKFYIPFEQTLQEKEKNIDKSSYTILGKAPSKIICPECGSSMDIKLGKYGRFFSCSKWPDCKGILGEDGKSEEEAQKEAYTEEFLKIFKQAPKTDKGKDYLLKRGRFGKFWAHPDYPKIKDTRPIEYNEVIFRQIYGEAPKAKDGTLMILRKGKFGEFWAHQNYPEIKEIQKIDKQKVKEQKKLLSLE